MIITYIPPLLQVTDSDLTAAMGTTTPTAEATVTLNCGDELVQAYTGVALIDPSSKFYWSTIDLAFYFQPAMWGLAAFVDGIYYISIKVSFPLGGYVLVDNCTFVDVTYKCKVAQLLNGITSMDTMSSITHLLHYSLVNGSNCGCNCTDMCTNFNNLTEILTDSTLQITQNDCGCN